MFGEKTAAKGGRFSGGTRFLQTNRGLFGEEGRKPISPEADGGTADGEKKQKSYFEKKRRGRPETTSQTNGEAESAETGTSDRNQDESV